MESAHVLKRYFCLPSSPSFPRPLPSPPLLSPSMIPPLCRVVAELSRFLTGEDGGWCTSNHPMDTKTVNTSPLPSPLSSAPPLSPPLLCPSPILTFSRRLCLVYEAISLVFRISISDNYFDTHRDPCEHMYAFVFNRLAVLMESCQPPREGTYVCMKACLR